MTDTALGFVVFIGLGTSALLGLWATRGEFWRIFFIPFVNAAMIFVFVWSGIWMGNPEFTAEGAQLCAFIAFLCGAMYAIMAFLERLYRRAKQIEDQQT